METVGWGEFLALASAVSWALAVVLFRQPGRLLPAFELNLFKNVLGFLLLTPTLLLLEGLSLPDYSLSELGVILLSGCLGIAVADTWYLRALYFLGAGRTGIISSLFSPFVILLSVAFLGESLKGWQIFGLVLVMLGILLFTWERKRSSLDRESVRKGTLYGIGGVFMMAVGIVMIKEILETRSFLWTAEIRLFGGVIGMLIVMLLRNRVADSRALFSLDLPWVQLIFAGFLGGYLSMIMWLAGYKLISASEASILNESTGAWTVLFAWLILGESVGVRKVAGLVLTIAGVAIMLLV